MVDAAASPFNLSLDTMLPALLQRYPATRDVLDRYGLRGCGGEHGPHESLRFFARTHGVDERTLMDEIRRAVATSSHHPGSRVADHAEPGLAEVIYRPFFLGGIAVVLTAGAVWGAWLLWKIGIHGDFAAASIHEVNAHGHAQIFGWVGLFIMGFALQALPRMWHVELPAPRLALAGFVAMVTGITVRTVAMASAPEVSVASKDWPATVALGGGFLELAAIVAVVGVLLTALRRSTVKTEPYMAFVVAGLGWFVLQAGAGLWHTWMTLTAETRDVLLWHVSTYQGPLRYLQLHGLAMFMILGVSIRMLPAMFGVPRIAEPRAWIAFGLLVSAVILEVTSFIGFRWTNQPAFAGGLLLGWIMLAAGVVLVAWPWRLWRALPTRDRSAKFIRAAYGWLAVALIMLLLLPVYQLVSGIPFSHAYYGAARHALAVGFISLMIMGISAKVVPTLMGRDPSALSALWLSFGLVNLGCLLRVSTQTLTDWHPAFFGVVGISGVLEVTGLAFWGAHLTWLMLTRPSASSHPPAGPPRPERVEPNHVVAEVLGWYPHTIDVFDRFGFTLLRNPVARRTLARTVTVAQAARMGGVRLEALVHALNEAAGACPEDGRSPDGLGGSQALRYDMPVKELISQWPDAKEILAQAGLNPDGSERLSVGEAADRAGVPRETLLAMLVRLMVTPDSHCCGNCLDCENYIEDANQSCDHAKPTRGSASPPARLEVSR